MKEFGIFALLLLIMAGCSDIDDTTTGKFSGYTIATGGVDGEQADDGARLNIENKRVTLTSPTWGTILVEGYESEYLGNATEGKTGLGEMTTPDGKTYPALLIAKVSYGASEATASFIISGNEAVSNLSFIQGRLPEIYAISGAYHGMAHVTREGEKEWKVAVDVNITVENAESTNQTLGISIGQMEDETHHLGMISVGQVSAVSKNGVFALSNTGISSTRIMSDGKLTTCSGTLMACEISAEGETEMQIEMYLDNRPCKITLYIAKQ